MPDHEEHLSDQELLLAADSEPGWRARRARAHMEQCLRCRVRAARMQNLLGQAAQAERSRLESGLPSPAVPRAILRSRLAELPSGHPTLFPRLGFAGALAVAALAAVMTAATAVSLAHSGWGGATFAFFAADRGVLPNRALTPGAARQVSLEQVCSLSHEEVVKTVSARERETVFNEYGISRAQSAGYEVDYLITPGLGGYDDLRNLWPEPYGRAKWNARRKDALEERLHEMVCSRQIDLSVAQQAIATNWIAAYQRYVKQSPSHVWGARTPWVPQTMGSVLVIGRAAAPRAARIW